MFSQLVTFSQVLLFEVLASFRCHQCFILLVLLLNLSCFLIIGQIILRHPRWFTQRLNLHFSNQVSQPSVRRLSCLGHL